jgi:hypothetical protein
MTGGELGGLRWTRVCIPARDAPWLEESRVLLVPRRGHQGGQGAPCDAHQEAGVVLRRETLVTA